VINIVIWSGGYDSTLILDQMCSAGDKNVWAFSIDWDMLDDNKREKEKRVRKKYKQYAKKKGYEFCHQTIAVSADMGARGGGNTQAMAWVGFIMPYLPSESTIHFGYHAADSFWCGVHYVEEAIRNLCAMGDRKVVVKYPLQYMPKWEIVKNCERRGIPDSCIWSCEHPIKKRNEILACGSCIPCINLKLANHEKKLRGA